MNSKLQHILAEFIQFGSYAVAIGHYVGAMPGIGNGLGIGAGILGGIITVLKPYLTANIATDATTSNPDTTK